jgi:hypothetical protein
MADEQEIGSARRFLEALEQRVGRVALHIVRRIDNDRAPLAQGGAGVQPLLHRADLGDRDVALDLVRFALLALLVFLVVLGKVGEHVDVGMLIKLGRGADQFARGGKGELHLAEARLARQQPGVMHPFAFQRIAPGGARRLVADKAHA